MAYGIKTKPCDNCGTSVTKRKQGPNRQRFWTCGASCAQKMRTKMGPGPLDSTWANRFRGQRDTRACARCGTPKTRYVTERNHDKPWYCSSDCARRARAGQPRKHKGDVVACGLCGALFYRSPQEIERGRRFCSHVCSHAGKKKERPPLNCVACSKPISLPPSMAKNRLYCSWTCTTVGKVKRPAGRTHNGKPVRIAADGYIRLWEPTHPNANRGWVLEHRWLMEQQLGRVLLTEEEVDHINTNRGDNRLENLQVLNRTEHRKKTGSDARAARTTMRDRLAEYERRFGPLD